MFCIEKWLLLKTCNFYIFFLLVVAATCNGHICVQMIARLNIWEGLFQMIYSSPMYYNCVSDKIAINVLLLGSFQRMYWLSATAEKVHNWLTRVLFADRKHYHILILSFEISANALKTFHSLPSLGTLMKPSKTLWWEVYFTCSHWDENLQLKIILPLSWLCHMATNSQQLELSTLHTSLISERQQQEWRWGGGCRALWVMWSSCRIDYELPTRARKAK